MDITGKVESEIEAFTAILYRHLENHLSSELYPNTDDLEKIREYIAYGVVAMLNSFMEPENENK